MAKNREPESKPEDSSDSGESLASGSGSEYESDSEPETQTQTQTPVPKPPTPTPQNPPPAESESESETESGSESESESESGPDTPQPEKAKPSPPNPTPSVQVSDAKGSAVGVKRGAGKAVETPEPKKPKKVETLVKKDVKDVKDVKVEDSSKKMFQRVFSEDDEIVLLKSMLEFTIKQKSDPVANIDEFLEFVKKYLPVDATKMQFLSKMKRLKGKYRGHASKVKDGQDLKISKSHERESYELSKKIWGVLDGETSNGDGVAESKKVNGSAMKKGGNKNGVMTAKLSGEDAVTVVALPVNDDSRKWENASARSVGVADGAGGVSMNLTVEERIMMEEIKGVDTETQKALGKKLREVEVAELELCARRCEYVAQKARLMIATKKNEL